jgi:hypothetical protein
MIFRYREFILEVFALNYELRIALFVTICILNSYRAIGCPLKGRPPNNGFGFAEG